MLVAYAVWLRVFTVVQRPAFVNQVERVIAEDKNNKKHANEGRKTIFAKCCAVHRLCSIVGGVACSSPYIQNAGIFTLGEQY